MDNQDILDRIQALVDEEHLLAALAGDAREGSGVSDSVAGPVPVGSTPTTASNGDNA